jgi:hypothetical protein
VEIGHDDSDTARLPEQIEGPIIGEDAGIDRCLDIAYREIGVECDVAGGALVTADQKIGIDRRGRKRPRLHVLGADQAGAQHQDDGSDCPFPHGRPGLRSDRRLQRTQKCLPVNDGGSAFPRLSIFARATLGPFHPTRRRGPCLVFFQPPAPCDTWILYLDRSTSQCSILCRVDEKANGGRCEHGRLSRAHRFHRAAAGRYTLNRSCNSNRS